MSKVLISDSLASQGIEVLDQAPGLEVLDRPGIAPGELLEAIREVEGLIVRSGTKVTRSVTAAAPKLRVIGRAGIGVDNVDVSAATERGIAVLNTPEGNNITTAEHAISLLLSLARHIPAATASLTSGSPPNSVNKAPGSPSSACTRKPVASRSSPISNSWKSEVCVAATGGVTTWPRVALNTVTSYSRAPSATAIGLIAMAPPATRPATTTPFKIVCFT